MTATAKHQSLVEVLEKARRRLQSVGEGEGRITREKAKAEMRELLSDLNQVEPEVLDDLGEGGRSSAKRFAEKYVKGTAVNERSDNGGRLELEKHPALALSRAKAHEWSDGYGGTGGQPVVKRNIETGAKSLVVQDQELRRLHGLMDRFAIVDSIKRHLDPSYRQNPGRGREELKSWQEYVEAVRPIAKAMGPEALKALTSTGSGTGDEWVPTGMSSSFIDAIFLRANVAPIFPLIEMPTNPFDMPASMTVPLGYSPAEGAAPSAVEGVATSKRTWTAEIFKSYETWTDEVEEDSILAVESIIRGKLIDGLALALDEAVLNGDSAGTHQDNDVAGGAADHPAKVNWTGLRAAAIDNSHTAAIGQAATFTMALLISIRTVIHRALNADPAQLAWIMSSEGLLNNIFDITQIQTQDVFGNRALISTGSVANILGSQVYVSERMPDDLHDTGVNTSGGDNDTTGIICVHRMAGRVGYRRRTTVETDKAITTGVNTMVASMRAAWQWAYDPATYASLGYGINVRTSATA